MAIERVTGRYGTDMLKTFASEDGKHYRGYKQNVEAIKKHVRQRHDMVNDAPVVGNPQGYRYAGSIPMTILVEWLTKTGIKMDEYARNEDNARTKFIAWLKSEHPALMPKAGASARPQIAVPVTYKKRASE